MRKKNKILIGSSSFLLPKSKSWEKIRNFNTIEFAAYGNIDSILENKNVYSFKILVVFFEDLIVDKKDINKRLNFLLSNINKSLISSSNETIICYADYYSKEIIRNSKVQNKFTEMNNFFKKKLYSLCDKNKNLSIIDLDIVFKIHGYNQIIDKRNWYLARCRLSEFGLDLLAEQIKKIIFSIKNPASKVLILDCDNTLWGGVVGEEGTYGIKIGTDGEGLMFQDFQRELIDLKNNGLILAISSKNNERDVMDVFKNNDQMKLQKKDISVFKINWKEKYTNIREIAKELNLALNSFVFWDDNPIEREKIKINLPEVRVIDVPNEIYNWIDLIKNDETFAKPIITSEDKKKTKQYQSAAKFNEDKKNKGNDNFLKNILLKPRIFKPNKSNITRFSQMTVKTNQFNFRTIRMTESEVKNTFNSNEEECFMCDAKDIYGDHGIIGLASVKKITKDIFFLNNYLLSCRILGRKIENWFIESIFQKLRENGVKKIIIGFIPSERNEIAEIFLKSLKLKKFTDIKILSLLNIAKKERLFIKELSTFRFHGDKYYE
jgi:FkbH-like protein